MKILVFEPDDSLRELLRICLEKQGHTVLAFKDPALCPVYSHLDDDSCRCPMREPCGDAIFIENRMRSISAIDFLKLQRRRGCKALDANKAVMSAGMTMQLEEVIAEFGCHYIKKPFHLGQIRGWVNDCRRRLEGRATGAPVS